jgi:hypothetical protein
LYKQRQYTRIMSTNSIPITINGIRFRSLIEARWAEMFSRLGWEWEYEPIELNGYIPDFIIKFPYKHLLVEVKGETNMENIEQYAEKIINSGWDGEFLLVCSTLGYEHGIYIGLLGSTKFSYSWKEQCDDNTPIKPKVKNSEFAHLSTCNECKKYTIYSDDYGWFCRNCGDGCSNKSLPRNRITKDIYTGHYCLDKTSIKTYFGNNCDCITYEKNKEYEKIYTFWNEAKNTSQWKPK